MLTYKTRQKESILEYLKNNGQNHANAEQIYEYFKNNESTVSKATIYRYLDKLVSEGSVRKYIIDDKACACYQYTGEKNICGEHFHLKCVDCGKLYHVECDELSRLAEHVEAHHNFKVNNLKTVLYGMCEDCCKISHEG